MNDVFNFKGTITPFAMHHDEPYYRVQGIEKLIVGTRHLFFASSVETNRNFTAGGIHLDADEWIATGTFRNSLYIEPISQLTPIRELKLLIEYQGALKLRLMCATMGKPLHILHEVKLFSGERTHYLLRIGSPTDLPENSRIFWHIDALAGGATIFDVNYVTNTPPRSDCRLAVLLRTYGRTSDVKAILKRFADAGKADPYFSGVLDNIDFWLLDTTPNCEKAYNEPWQSGLNLRVLVGPNLGGGGNASHMLRLFEDACRASDSPPTELLMLDDDLSLTPETLARYFMFCAYRAQEVICSLPVMMKSRPTVVWEDGGYWGRLNFHEGGNFSRKRNLFPNLLKHGKQLDGPENLDAFCPLNTCEYSTFIFFGLSMNTFRKLGYPAAFFLRGDDIEFSLRAQELGVQMVTNPNLAAWHEPSHSYGQEYMAILHGIIINLTYGDYNVDFYTRFFEERLYEHASIDDAVGIRLYRDILAELVDKRSAVLTPDFQTHYIKKIKELGSVRMMKISEADRHTFEQKAKDNSVLLVPFVYPGYHKDTRKFRSVVLINHSTKAYREVQPISPLEKTSTLGEYVDLLAQFAKDFDVIRSHWEKQLKASSQEEFWTAIRDKYVSATRDIFNFNKTRDTLSTVITLQEVAFQEVGSEGGRTRRKLSKSGAAGSKAVSGRPAEIDQLTPEAQDDEVSSAGLETADQLTDTEQSEPAIQKIYSTDDNAAKDQRKGRKKDNGNGAENAVSGSEEEELLPSDFDPAMYLHINVDVKESGIDPTEHYIKYGRKEGRKYRI